MGNKLMTWNANHMERRTKMKLRWLLILLVAASGCAVAASPVLHRNNADKLPLFEMQELFESVRIPHIIVARDGSVLAFARSCRLIRRSENHGRTWSTVREVGPDVTGSAIVDDNNGDVLIVCGRGYLYRSQDHGKTRKKEDIVIKPNDVGHGTPDGVPVSLGASESGITLTAAKHKGRLLMPARIQPPKGDNAQEYWPYNYNTAIYSDHGGRTWQTGGPLQSGTGERTLAELSDGRIYYNSRCHMAVDHRRRIAWSHDGGHMWTDWQVSDHLYEVGEPFYFKYGTKPSYGCNAGLVRIPLEANGGRHVLLFSTPDNPGGDRVSMTVWASFDGAQTWPAKRLVYGGPSAYSSLAADRDGTVYLLFENGTKELYERISVARFNLDWVAGEKDWRDFLTD
jgi:sialidase-1